MGQIFLQNASRKGSCALCSALVCCTDLPTLAVHKFIQLLKVLRHEQGQVTLRSKVDGVGPHPTPSLPSSFKGTPTRSFLAIAHVSPDHGPSPGSAVGATLEGEGVSWPSRICTGR